MAIRAFINTAPMPEMQTQASGVYPYSRRSWTSLGITAGQRVMSYNSAGGINMYSLQASTGGALYLGMFASDVTDGVSPNSTIGFTYEPPTNSNVIDSFQVLSIGAATFTQLELSPSAYTVQIALIIDRTVTPNTCILIRDGVFVAKKSLGGALYAGGTSIYFACSTNRAGMGSTFRDFYFVDDTKDDTQCSFIAAPVCGSSYIINGTFPSDWTPVGGGSNLLSVASSPIYNTTDLTTPTYKSPATPSKLKLSLNGFVNDPNAKFFGFETVWMALKTDAATVGKVTYELDGIVANQSNMPFIGTNTMNFDMRPGLALTAPDGGPWTSSKLSRLVITVTPTT